MIRRRYPESLSFVFRMRSVTKRWGLYFFSFHETTACHLHFPLPTTFNHSLVISASCCLPADPFRSSILSLTSPPVILHLCSRCSSGYACPRGMRMLPLGSSCDWGERSVRGGVTGSTVHLSPHPYPPHCSGQTGRPLHDRGCVMQSHALAMNFLPLLLYSHMLFCVSHVISMPRD